jgi:periplasmic mercuric ion binding protein
MSKRIPVAIALLMALSPLAAQAAQKTAVLAVEKANCALCAPVVKGALSKVPGVKSVKVAEANADAPAVATVIYDDAVTNVASLTTATTNAGFPSHKQ